MRQRFPFGALVALFLDSDKPTFGLVYDFLEDPDQYWVRGLVGRDDWEPLEAEVKRAVMTFAGPMVL